MESYESKRFTACCILFCLLVFLFFILNQFHVISNMTTYICCTYVTYFAGLAMYFNAKNLNVKSKQSSYGMCIVLSIVLITLSIVFLVYGIITEEIPFFTA